MFFFSSWFLDFFRLPSSMREIRSVFTESRHQLPNTSTLPSVVACFATIPPFPIYQQCLLHKFSTRIARKTRNVFDRKLNIAHSSAMSPFAISIGGRPLCGIISLEMIVVNELVPIRTWTLVRNDCSSSACHCFAKCNCSYY